MNDSILNPYHLITFAPGIISFFGFLIINKKRALEKIRSYGYGKFGDWIFYIALIFIFYYIDIVTTNYFFNIKYIGIPNNLVALTNPLLILAILSWLGLGLLTGKYFFISSTAASIKEGWRFLVKIDKKYLLELLILFFTMLSALIAGFMIGYIIMY